MNGAGECDQAENYGGLESKFLCVQVVAARFQPTAAMWECGPSGHN